MANAYSSPLTFELSESLLKKIRGYLKTGSYSYSDAVRFAIETAKLSKKQFSKTEMHQLSVRISQSQRDRLASEATRVGVSLGEYLRVALEDLPDTPPEAFQTLTKTRKMPKKAATPKVAKKAAKKAVKNAPAKKAAKKVVKKAAVKKAPAKKVAAKKVVAKKVAAKKAPAKKVAAKKAPAKKAAVKKAAVKKAAAKKTVAKKAVAKKAAAKKVASRKTAKKS